MTTKLAQQTLRFTQHQDTVDKKFAQLEALIRKSEKKAANEVINAFNTGRSFASKHSTQNNVSPRLVDSIPQLDASKMRLASPESRAQGRPSLGHVEGKVMFEVHGEQV